MDEKCKIAILKWEEGKVPVGLMQLETLPGNSTNLKSYPFPVKLVSIKGANADTVIIHPSQELLKEMICISKRLIKEDGIQAISTSCGFNAIFQKGLAEALDVPVFTSALLQVPLIHNMIGKDQSIGIITANKSALTREHFHACGISDDIPLVVLGLENASEWSKIFKKPDQGFAIDTVADEVIHVVKAGIADNPNIGAIVLECTDLPPFAEKIRAETKLPVFDFSSMMGHVAIALGELKLF